MSASMGSAVLLYEASDVARYIGLSYSGVYALVERGALKPYAVTKRGVRLFKPEDVFALKRARDARGR